MANTDVVIAVELKKMNSFCSRMADSLDRIDKSLSTGQLQDEMRFFLTQFKPELAESYAVRKTQDQRKNIRSCIEKARLKASATTVSKEKDVAGSSVTNPKKLVLAD